MMKVLVTGGAGFIGSHTSVELLNAGHDVVIVDNFSNSKPTSVAAIEAIAGKPVSFYEADVRDAEAVHRIFVDHPIDAVIHFAGLKSVTESVRIPLAYYGNNLDSTIVLCQEMQNAGCRRLVFSSSATVYGASGRAPFREDMPTSATNPYGRTKLMIERILTDMAAAIPDWSICLLRYFNPIGAEASGLLGEDPNGIPNNLVPYVAQVAAGIRPEVLVYGNDYETPDGTGVRDYIHVVDLARGHLAAMQFVQQYTGAEVINLGTGRGTSVLEILDAYSKACGRQIAYRIAPRRPGDVAVSYADTDKARRLLGWHAEKDVDAMCADSWNFAKKRYAGVV